MRYFEAADLPAIVRVPSRGYHHIARALDMGAEGLMLPMVGTAEEARDIVRWMNHARGRARRGAPGRARPLSAGPVIEKLTAANRRTTLFCQIETAEGSRTPRPLRRRPVSTACGSAISICRPRSACPGNSIPRSSPMRSAGWSRRPASMAVGRPAGARLPRNRARIQQAGFRFHLLFGRHLGAARCPRGRDRQAARRLRSG